MPPVPSRFTFVNQHEDVQSVRERRVRNDAHRHEIKSHVMRGVRQHEHVLGKKRPTGRPLPRAMSIGGATNQDGRPSNPDNATSIPRRSSSPGERTFRAHDNAIMRARSQPLLPPSSKLNMCPSNHFLDPFATLPMGNIPHATIEVIIQYCISDFVPMTFPAEWSAAERQARVDMIIHARPAGFLGLLATNAAHRAILHTTHEDLSPSARVHAELIHDPDYSILLRHAYRATCVKQHKGELDGEFLEACFGLICAQTMVGDFDQARALQQYVREVLPNIEVPKISQAWLPLVDMSVAMGLLSKPTIALPWPRLPVPDDVISRIRPASTSQYSHLGAVFLYAAHITPHLRRLLADAVLICHFAEFNASRYGGLDAHEHIMYRCKSYELHQDVLNYVYDIFWQSEHDGGALLVPALEQVIRLAILGMISGFVAVVHPATGLGRALTNHQKHAMDFYGPRMGSDMDRAELKIVVWALFVYAACAFEQTEGPEFEHTLAQACSWLGVRDWEAVEGVLLECLYVPNMQGKAWRGVWQRAQPEVVGLRSHEPATMQEWMTMNLDRVQKEWNDAMEQGRTYGLH